MFKKGPQMRQNAARKPTESASQRAVRSDFRNPTRSEQPEASSPHSRSGRNPLLRAADVSTTVPVRERGTAAFRPPACRTLAGMQARALPLRQGRGRDEPRCRIGRRPAVSANVARPLRSPVDSTVCARTPGPWRGRLPSRRGRTEGASLLSTALPSSIAEEIRALEQVPARSMRAAASGCLLSGASQAIGMHLATD
jgi:hypothetical protein